MRINIPEYEIKEMSEEEMEQLLVSQKKAWLEKHKELTELQKIHIELLSRIEELADKGVLSKCEQYYLIAATGKPGNR